MIDTPLPKQEEPVAWNETCPRCKGTGSRMGHSCPNCDGLGVIHHATRPSLDARTVGEPVADVHVKRMNLSGGRSDFFVAIKVGDREVTPHVFRDEYKAAYHVALYNWLLNGVGDEPDIVAFGPLDWPAQVTRHATLAPALDARMREARELLRNEIVPHDVVGIKMTDDGLMFQTRNGGTRKPTDDEREGMMFTRPSLDARMREGLVAAIRAAKLALFTINKHGVMPNSSWESGFNRDLKTAEDALATLSSPVQSGKAP